MNSRLQSTLIFLAILIFPLLSYLSINISEPGFSSTAYLIDALSLIILAVTAFGAGSYLLAKLFRLRVAAIMLAAAVMFAMLFTYEEFESFFSRRTSIWIYFPTFFGGIALVGVAVYLISTRRELLNLLGIFATTVIIIPIINISLQFIGNGPQTAPVDDSALSGSIQTVKLANSERPNLYFIIPDAYGGDLALDRFVSIRNSDFYDALEARGFFVADDSRSPYNMTYLSIAAILRLDYPVVETSLPYRLSRQDFYPRMMNHPIAPAAVRKFQSIGYEFNLFGNNWGRCNAKHVICPVQGERPLYSYELSGLLRATPFKAVARKLLRESPTEAIKNLTLHLRDKGLSNSPSVFFAHNLAPHPPYYLESDCSVRDDYEEDLVVWSDRAKPLYEANLRCVNKQLLTLIDLIDEMDPGAMVIIAADHGTAFAGSQVAEERAAVLTAARLPERCDDSLTPDINAVNLMRISLSCAASEPPTLVENLTYFGTYETEGPTAGKVRLVPVLSPKSSE